MKLELQPASRLRYSSPSHRSYISTPQCKSPLSFQQLPHSFFANSFPLIFMRIARGVGGTSRMRSARLDCGLGVRSSLVTRNSPLSLLELCAFARPLREESALPQNMRVTLLESALTNLKNLKSLESYSTKSGGEGTGDHPRLSWRTHFWLCSGGAGEGSVPKGSVTLTRFHSFTLTLFLPTPFSGPAHPIDIGFGTNAYNL